MNKGFSTYYIYRRMQNNGGDDLLFQAVTEGVFPNCDRAGKKGRDPDGGKGTVCGGE